MPYIIGIIFVVIVVCGLVVALKEQSDAEKSLNIPYRVVKNGLGKYQLQKYKKIEHDYTPLRRRWIWAGSFCPSCPAPR